ncbi:hypothetical protein [Maridesulfovibrio bastinii]|uniref:hypothetical protein n=1 Tax=Maridesulfovibrio bastinii TaxID=47157 RepID=UPI00040ECD57|nr:hypothetical protein [Maridesulfovibrio bastinii]
MKKLINICLALVLLCGCTLPENSSGSTVNEIWKKNAVAVTEFSDSSTQTSVTIKKFNNPDSLKSYLQDSYFISIVDIKTGKKILSSQLTAANGRMQVNRVWAYKKGALVYGYTQKKAGKANRCYLLLLIDGNHKQPIYLEHSLPSVFFDRKTGLVGWKKIKSSIAQVAFINVATGKKITERKADSNFFYAKTDGNNSVYLFAMHKHGLSVSKYTISNWKKKWSTTIPIKRLTGKKVKISEKILSISAKDIDIKISTETGKKLRLP